MNRDYRNTLIAIADYLIEIRHGLFEKTLNVAMNNELNGINDAFEDGDVYEFNLKHLDNSSDSNLQRLVDLIKKIESTEIFISNVNGIEDSELSQER